MWCCSYRVVLVVCCVVLFVSLCLCVTCFGLIHSHGLFTDVFLFTLPPPAGATWDVAFFEQRCSQGFPPHILPLAPDGIFCVHLLLHTRLFKRLIHGRFIIYYSQTVYNTIYTSCSQMFAGATWNVALLKQRGREGFPPPPAPNSIFCVHLLLHSTYSNILCTDGVFFIILCMGGVQLGV